MKVPLFFIASLAVAAFFARFHLGGSSHNTGLSARSASAPTAISERTSRRSRGTKSHSASFSSWDRQNSISSPGREPKGLGPILSSSDPMLRMEEVLTYIRALSIEEFPEALDDFKKAGLLDKKSIEYEILLTAWAKVDPLGALAAISGSPDAADASVTIVTAWASRDPEAAEHWARKNFDGNADPTEGNPHMVGVISGLVERDLESATRLLLQMPESRAQNDAIKSVLEKLQTNDLETALNWAESQPEDVLAVAAPYLVKEMTKREDFAEASEWLAAHDGNPNFDESIEKLVKQARKDAPELAADWAARITDEQSREKALTKLAGKWLKDDPVRAQEYLNQENIPESVRRHLTAPTTTEGTPQ